MPIKRHISFSSSSSAPSLHVDEITILASVWSMIRFNKRTLRSL
ncbi:hypothetical protein VPHD479_0122 [Vibrio phage D479]